MNKLLGVIRTVTIPTYLFDHLKDCQRHYERIEGRKLSNSQTLAILLQQHRDPCHPRQGKSQDTRRLAWV